MSVAVCQTAKDQPLLTERAVRGPLDSEGFIGAQRDTVVKTMCARLRDPDQASGFCLPPGPATEVFEGFHAAIVACNGTPRKLFLPFVGTSPDCLQLPVFRDLKLTPCDGHKAP